MKVGHSAYFESPLSVEQFKIEELYRPYFEVDRADTLDDGRAAVGER